MKTSDELVFAVQAGDSERIRACLAAGADPDARARDGRPVLHLAVAAGADAAVMALLDAGADADQLDGHGLAALDLALEAAALEDGVFDGELMTTDRPALNPATIDRLIAATTVRDSPLGDGDFEDEVDVGDIPEVELAELPAELAAFYARPAVLSRLRAAELEEDYRAALAMLAQRFVKAPAPASLGAGFVFTISALESPDFAALQAEFARRGFLLFFGGDADAAEEESLLLLPTRDPLEALVLVGTRSPDEPGSASLLLEFFRHYPARFTSICPAEAQGRFEPLPANAWALAVELCNLCPNAAEPTGGLDAFIESLERHGEFHLWWD